MKVIATPLKGLLLIEPTIFGDSRGFFLETYQRERYQQLGIKCEFVQDNTSRSHQNVLRGLHYQLKHPQAKLISVLRGKVFDIAVDIRCGSPTFGQWFGVELSDENHRQLFIPAGFAHGFSVLSETVDFMYKCSDYYYPEYEKGIAWNDPDLAIKWQLTQPELSAKDQKYNYLKDVPVEQLPVYEGEV